jgi:3-methyladenine DNA glycosylase AlkD
MKNDLLANIRRELKQNINESYKQKSQSFFNEKIKFHGVSIMTVGKIARKYFNEIKHKSKKEVFTLCEELLKADYIEEAFIAYDWAYFLHDQFEEKDFKTFEKWLNAYVSNWAECDTFGNHTIGSFVEKFPEYIPHLKKWTRSKNRWARRGAAVSFVLPARKGLFLKDILEIADRLLIDKDDLVQKGYGWMLKEASKAHQQEIFQYVMDHKKVMPRTALRYAIEKLPPDLKAKAMERN